MKWNYRCPNCRVWVCVDWEMRDRTYTCYRCRQSRVPSSPAEDYEAYVDTHDWPDEMEEVVISIKGTTCTVPGCTESYETLDHRVPYSLGGKTSVNNLFSMCNEPNESKGDSNYRQWLISRLTR